MRDGTVGGLVKFLSAGHSRPSLCQVARKAFYAPYPGPPPTLGERTSASEAEKAIRTYPLARLAAIPTCVFHFRSARSRCDTIKGVSSRVEWRHSF